MNSNTFPVNPFTPNSIKMKLVCIGDSITSFNESVLGNQADDGRHWTILVSQRLGIQVTNKGISGQSSAEILARFQTDVIDLKPTHCILQEGGNDTFRKIPVSTTMANIIAMVQMCIANNIVPIVMCCTPGQGSIYWYQLNGVPDPFQWEDNQYLPEFRRQQQAYCEANNVMYLDVYKPLITYNGLPDYELFTPERLHQNISGYLVIAEVACNALKKFL